MNRKHKPRKNLPKYMKELTTVFKEITKLRNTILKMFCNYYHRQENK